jgi:hypothetical protein
MSMIEQDPRVGGMDRNWVWLRRLALTIFVFGLLHHTDHVIRGNHVGWPFSHVVTPFTFSLLIYPLLAYGLTQLRRDRVRRGFWISLSLLLAALLTFVHFVPLPKYENVCTDIYLLYADPTGSLSRYSLAPPSSHYQWFLRAYGPYASPVWGWLALLVVAVLTLAAYSLVWVSFRLRPK